MLTASASVMGTSADGVGCAMGSCEVVKGVLSAMRRCERVEGVLVICPGCAGGDVAILFCTDETELIPLGQAVASFDSIEAVSRGATGNGAGDEALGRAAAEERKGADTVLEAIGLVFDGDAFLSAPSRQRSDAACHKYDFLTPVPFNSPERRRSRLR